MRTQAPDLSTIKNESDLSIFNLKQMTGRLILLAIVALRLLMASKEGMCMLMHFAVHSRRVCETKELDENDNDDGDNNDDDDDRDAKSRMASLNTELPADDASVNASECILPGCSQSVTKCAFKKAKYMHNGLKFDN